MWELLLGGGTIARGGWGKFCWGGGVGNFAEEGEILGPLPLYETQLKITY